MTSDSDLEATNMSAQDVRRDSSLLSSQDLSRRISSDAEAHEQQSDSQERRRVARIRRRHPYHRQQSPFANPDVQALTVDPEPVKAGQLGADSSFLTAAQAAAKLKEEAEKQSKSATKRLFIRPGATTLFSYISQHKTKAPESIMSTASSSSTETGGHKHLAAKGHMSHTTPDTTKQQRHMKPSKGFQGVVARMIACMNCRTNSGAMPMAFPTIPAA